MDKPGARRAVTLESLLGVDLPVVQAPMAGVQASALALEVSNAGGLGSLPCAMLTVDAMRAELALIRDGTSRPFNVNFFCHGPPAPDAAREARWRAALAPGCHIAGVALRHLGQAGVADEGHAPGAAVKQMAGGQAAAQQVVAAHGGVAVTLDVRAPDHQRHSAVGHLVEALVVVALTHDDQAHGAPRLHVAAQAVDLHGIDAREQHVVAPGRQGVGDAADQAQQEGIGQRLMGARAVGHDDRDRAVALDAQVARALVHLVAQRAGDVLDAVAKVVAHARLTAQRTRHRRHRHARQPRHVGHLGPLAQGRRPAQRGMGDGNAAQSHVAVLSNARPTPGRRSPRRAAVRCDGPPACRPARDRTAAAPDRRRTGPRWPARPRC